MTEPCWLKANPKHPDYSNGYDVCSVAELRYYQLLTPNKFITHEGNSIYLTYLGKDQLVARIIPAKVICEDRIVETIICEKNPDDSPWIILPDDQELGSRNGIFFYDGQAYIATPPTRSHPETWFLRRSINSQTQHYIANSELGKLLIPTEV